MKATYKLEGDGPLALYCYKVIETIKASVHAAHTPNVLAVADKLSRGEAHTKQLTIDHAQQCIQPGIQSPVCHHSTAIPGCVHGCTVFSSPENA